MADRPMSDYYHLHPEAYHEATFHIDPESFLWPVQEADFTVFDFSSCLALGRQAPEVQPCGCRNLLLHRFSLTLQTYGGR